MKCKKCGHELISGATFCSFCGAKIDSVEEVKVEKKKKNAVKCIYCGHEIKEGAEFCTNCGSKAEDSRNIKEVDNVTEVPLKCSHCGHEIQKDSAFCTFCGAKVDSSDNNVEPVPKKVRKPFGISMKVENIVTSIFLIIIAILMISLPFAPCFNSSFSIIDVFRVISNPSGLTWLPPFYIIGAILVFIIMLLGGFLLFLSIMDLIKMTPSKVGKITSLISFFCLFIFLALIGFSGSSLQTPFIFFIMMFIVKLIFYFINNRKQYTIVKTIFVSIAIFFLLISLSVSMNVTIINGGYSLPYYAEGSSGILNYFGSVQIAINNGRVINENFCFVSFIADLSTLACFIAFVSSFLFKKYKISLFISAGSLILFIVTIILNNTVGNGVVAADSSGISTQFIAPLIISFMATITLAVVSFIPDKKQKETKE